MHPTAQIPAYEWAFGDVNPPVQAWAAYRIFQIEHKRYGYADYLFLERVFQKLLLNFTWWVNREDPDGHNVFRRRFPRPRQYRGLRSQREAAGGLAASNSPTARVGWPSTR